MNTDSLIQTLEAAKSADIDTWDAGQRSGIDDAISIVRGHFTSDKLQCPDALVECVASTIYAIDAKTDESWEYWKGWPCGGSHTRNKYIELAKVAIAAMQDFMAPPPLETSGGKSTSEVGGAATMGGVNSVGRSSDLKPEEMVLPASNKGDTLTPPTPNSSDARVRRSVTYIEPTLEEIYRRALQNIAYALNNSRNLSESLHTIGNEASWALSHAKVPKQQTASNAPVKTFEQYAKQVLRDDGESVREYSLSCMEGAFNAGRYSVQQTGEGYWKTAFERLRDEHDALLRRLIGPDEQVDSIERFSILWNFYTKQDDDDLDAKGLKLKKRLIEAADGGSREISLKKCVGALRAHEHHCNETRRGCGGCIEQTRAVLDAAEVRYGD